MKKETIKVLIDLNNGNSFPISKDTEENLYDTIFKLVNLNILRKEKNLIKINDRKLLSKVIEFESIPKYLEWFENKNESNNSITNNFNNNTETYNNVGIVNKKDNYGNQSSEIDFTKNIIKNEIEKPTKSDNKIWTKSNILFTIITGLIVSFIFWLIIT